MEQSVERLRKKTAFFPARDLKITAYDSEFAHPGCNKNGGGRINMAGIYRLGWSEPVTFVIDPEIGPFMGQKLHETYVKNGTLTQEEVDNMVTFDKVADRIFDALDGAIVLTHQGFNDFASLKTMYQLANHNVDKHNTKVDAHNAFADRLNSMKTPLMTKIKKKEHKPHFRVPVPYAKIDTFHLLGMKIVEEKVASKKLELICESWGIEPQANHNAGIDALACFRLFVVLCNRFPKLRRNRFSELFEQVHIAHLPGEEWLERAAILPADGSAVPPIDGQFAEGTVLDTVNYVEDFGSSCFSEEEQEEEEDEEEQSLKAKVFSRFFSHPSDNDPLPI